MTTYVTLVPSAQGPFQFQATLDGNIYNVVVSWLVFGQYWYLQIYDLSGNLVLYRRIAGSPVGTNLESLSWAEGYATAVTSTPHGCLIGATTNLTFTGCSPDAYNGTFPVYVADPVTLVYPLTQDPGPATALGAVAYNLNLVQGYFFTSTLVWRQANNQFEVTP